MPARSGVLRRTSCQRLRLTLAGLVVARKSRRSRSTSSGRSIGRKWPAPSTISRRLPGISSCAMWAWLTGITWSRSPQMIIVGTSWARYSRSRALTRWPAMSITARIVWMKARWARTSVRRAHALHTSLRNGSALSPNRPRARPGHAEDVVQLVTQDHRQHVLGAGHAEEPQQRVSPPCRGRRCPRARGVPPSAGTGRRTAWRCRHRGCGPRPWRARGRARRRGRGCPTA